MFRSTHHLTKTVTGKTVPSVTGMLQDVQLTHLFHQGIDLFFPKGCEFFDAVGIRQLQQFPGITPGGGLVVMVVIGDKQGDDIVKVIISDL